MDIIRILIRVAVLLTVLLVLPIILRARLSSRDLDRIKRRFSSKAFDLFYIIVMRKRRMYAFCTGFLFGIFLEIIPIGLFFWPNLFSLSSRFFTLILTILFGCWPLIFILDWLVHLRKKFDKVVIKPILISSEFGALKNCSLNSGKVFNYALFTKSVTFLATASQLDLTERKVQRKVLNSFYHLFLVFDQAVAYSEKKRK